MFRTAFDKNLGKCNVYCYFYFREIKKNVFFWYKFYHKQVKKKVTHQLLSSQLETQFETTRL